MSYNIKKAYYFMRESNISQRILSYILGYRFQPGEIEGPVNMPYRLFVPNGYEQTSSRQYPVVLTLHGAGKRGNDNRKQMYSSAVFYSSKRVQQTQPCFVLAPQCPLSSSWADVMSWDEGVHQLRDITPALETTIHLLDEIIDQYRIDPEQQLLTGFSMGGYGTWDAIVRFPDRFEAAVPISGGGIPEQAECLRSVRVWAFHGAKDETVPVSGTRQMIQAMRDVGLEPRYTEFEMYGHTSLPVFKQDGLVEWLFN